MVQEAITVLFVGLVTRRMCALQGIAACDGGTQLEM